MSNKVTKYECEYCKKVYDYPVEADECFYSHNIICLIEKAYGDHDCWGKSETNWQLITDKVFKNPQSANKYINENEGQYRTIYAELI